MSMLFNNKNHSVESVPGGVSALGSVHFALDNEHSPSQNVLVYDPNQSAHESVMTAAIKPNTKQFSNAAEKEPRSFVLTLEGDDDHSESSNEERMKTLPEEQQCKEPLLPCLVNCSILDYDSPQNYPFVCHPTVDNKTTSDSSDVATSDDDPWYCEHCETWFGSPDPSYPDHCRCFDLTLPRDNNKTNTSKNDTLSSNDTASIYSQTMHKDFR